MVALLDMIIPRKYRKKPVVVEAITFDQLVEYGKEYYKERGYELIKGMPWRFVYAEHGITHENDDCYLVSTLEGTMRFNRGDMLITGVAGEIYPCRLDIFDKTYEGL